MRPGKQGFRRGGFRERRPDFNPKKIEIKIPISIKLDKDIVDFFKKSAAVRHAAPYQTQTNTALREYMEVQNVKNEPLNFAELIKNAEWITYKSVAGCRGEIGSRARLSDEEETEIVSSPYGVSV